jgi:hypothetical protein
MDPITKLLENRRQYAWRRLCQYTQKEWSVKIVYTTYIVYFVCMELGSKFEYVTRSEESDKLFSLDYEPSIIGMLDSVIHSWRLNAIQEKDV